MSAVEDLQTLAADVDAVSRLSSQFVLRSGQVSTEYFDKYLFEAQPVLLRRVAAAMVPLLPRDTAMVAGLELGGIPIATMVSSLTGLPTLFVRKQPKPYGTRRAAEGGEVAGTVVTLIEDVITTGGAVRDAAVALRAQGATVAVVVCAINRGAEEQPLDDVAIEVRPILSRNDLDVARERSDRR